MLERFTSYLDRVRFRCRRELSSRVARRLHRFNLNRPIISFCFDDFPRNALATGGAILRQHGMFGTYYVSFGLAGTLAPTGPIFQPAEIQHLLADGHELGCHTFDHLDAWETDALTFATSLDRNQTELSAIFPGTAFQTMSYPISCPNPGVKRVAARRFTVCRGGGQTFNSGNLDRNCLKAFFLEKTRENPAVVREVMDQTCRANGWLILATHDISDRPTPFGCTPQFFEQVVRHAVNSGADLQPVAKAWESVRSHGLPQVR